MKRAERKKLEERYLNDTAVLPAARVNYLASKYMDMPILVVMGAATVASGGITAAGYIESRTETATIQFQIAAIPPRIERFLLNGTII